MSDLISRQAAIEAIDKHLRTTDVPVSYPGIVSALTEWLNELPPAQPNSKESSFTRKALDTISRQARCEYCNEDFDGYVRPIEKNCHAFISGRNTLNIELGGFRRECRINYCPMCGRRLTDG